MPVSSSRIIIISTCTVGVFALVKSKKNDDENGENLKNKSKNKSKNLIEDSLANVKPAKTFEITTTVSIELSKKQVSSPITCPTNPNDVSSKLRYKSFKETATPRDEDEADGQDKKKQMKSPTKLKKYSDHQQLDEEKFTLNELDPILKRKLQLNLENQASLILDKPIFIAGDIMHESAGYLEEDDIDSKEHFDNLSESFFNDEDRNEKKEDENLANYDEKVRNLAELKNALHEKNRNHKYKLELEEKYFVFQEENKAHKIIKSEEFLYILKHLYIELHSKLIELNDNFDEERRRYFQKDEKIYTSIIGYNLQKKEEFFLSVVSHLMGRLSISQEVLDCSFYYYFNMCDQNLPIVKQIKESYEEVYNAGLKYSIAPKSLTKKLLRKIYLFQLEMYEKLSRKNIYKPDWIDIMIVDHTYAEYGLDSECIKATAKKFNIREDPEFIPLLQRIGNFQNNSFII